MAREMLLPPSARGLSTSMRDIGYTLETAIADLIDNSITAGARNVDVRCVPGAEDPILTVTDDGCGMDENEIIDAMRHGRIQGRETCDPNDLGKFGLGLKTASFSQCKRLAVISRNNGRLSGAEWDLSIVDARDEWVISILDPDEIARLQGVSVPHPSGTAVVWRDLDRLTEGIASSEIISEKLASVVDHLGLVFHRFLAGEVGWHDSLAITVNGHVVSAADPYFTGNPATQALPEQSIEVIPGHCVAIQPYVLPHFSKLRGDTGSMDSDLATFRENQGGYVYRNCRLIAWGDWFGIRPKKEVTKLARVRIDYTRTLDDHWTIDIKKSKATPPTVVRKRLSRILIPVEERSKKVHESRGWTRYSKQRFPLWKRIEEHNGIRYSISEDHPVYVTLLERLSPEHAGRLRFFVKSLASALPIDAIYADWAGRPQRVKQTSDSLEQNSQNQEVSIRVRLAMLEQCIGSIKNDRDAENFRQLVQSTQQFERHRDEVEAHITRARAQ